MRVRSAFGVVGVAGAILIVAGALPASGAPPWRWNSPNKVTSGAPFAVSSTTACPPAPTPGDSVLVGITLLYASGGGSGTVIAANPDGSWANHHLHLLGRLWTRLHRRYLPGLQRCYG